VFPRLLFLLTVLLAVVLAAMVLVSPSLDVNPQDHDAGSRLLAVFAQDAMVRRTALASAAGLLVTAFVFFRPQRGRAGDARGSSGKFPPPGNFAGA
jgi:hypothetical protein